MTLIPALVFSSISVVFSVFQTNIFNHITSFSYQIFLPDLSFIVLVYCAFVYGSMPGQIVGFVNGLVMDFMSLAPFGFNALTRTVACHIIGRFKGAILLDRILLPLALVTASLIIKSLITIIVCVFLGISYMISKEFSSTSLIQFGLTILVTPLVFWPLRGIHSLIQNRRSYR